MINKRLQKLEQYLKKNNYFKEYTTLRLIKNAGNPNIWSQTGGNWDTLLPSETSILRANSEEELAEAYRSKFKEYTIDQLRALHPQLYKKAIMFSWICDLKQENFDTANWDQMMADGGLDNIVNPMGNVEKERELIINESEEMAAALDEWRSSHDAWENFGAILNESNENVLDTEEGRDAVSFVTSFLYENGVIEMLPEAIMNGEIGSDLESRLRFQEMYTMRGEEAEGVELSSEIFANTFAGQISDSNNSYHTIQQDMMVLNENRIYSPESPEARGYLYHKLGVENGYWNPTADWSPGDTVYSQNEEGEVFFPNEFETPEARQWSPHQAAAAPPLSPEFRREAWASPPTLSEPGLPEHDAALRTLSIWNGEHGVGPWDPRWGKLLALSQIVENVPNIYNELDGVNFGSQNLTEDFSWPDPIYEREAGLYERRYRDSFDEDSIKGYTYGSQYYEPLRGTRSMNRNSVLGTDYENIDWWKGTWEQDWRRATDPNYLWREHRPMTRDEDPTMLSGDDTVFEPSYGFWGGGQIEENRKSRSVNYSGRNMLRDSIGVTTLSEAQMLDLYSFYNMYGNTRLNNYYRGYGQNYGVYSEQPDTRLPAASTGEWVRDWLEGTNQLDPQTEDEGVITNEVYDKEKRSKLLSGLKKRAGGRPPDRDPRTYYQSQQGGCPSGACHQPSNTSEPVYDWLRSPESLTVGRSRPILSEAGLVNPGYTVWAGSTVDQIIEIRRYCGTYDAEVFDCDEATTRIAQMKLQDGERRKNMGLNYNPNMPPGMNELVRATYQPHLAPFYMDDNTSQEYRNMLGFQTYNMSVPRSLRTFWYVGKATELGSSHSLYDGAQEVSYPYSESSSVSDSPDYIIGTTDPGSFNVTYYKLDRGSYDHLLSRYSVLTQNIRPTISTWMRYAAQTRIEGNDPRLLEYYRLLGQYNNDPMRSMAVPRVHPHGDLNLNTLSYDEIDAHGTSSEWLIDQFWASQTNTTIEFIEQMHTTGFSQKTSQTSAPTSGMATAVHFVWDMAGMIPVAGMVFDVTHIGYYYWEGSYLFAALGLLVLAPFAGDVFTPIAAGFKYNAHALAAFLGKPGKLHASKRFVESACRKIPMIDCSKLTKALDDAATADPRLLGVTEHISDLSQAIRGAKLIPYDDAVLALGGGAYGARRLQAMKYGQLNDEAGRMLQGELEAALLLRRYRGGTGWFADGWHRLTKVIPDWWGPRILKGGAPRMEGVVHSAVRSSAGVSTLNGWTRWNLGRSALARAELADINQGIKMAFQRRAMDPKWTNYVKGRQVADARTWNPSRQSGRWFDDDVGYLTQRGVRDRLAKMSFKNPKTWLSWYHALPALGKMRFTMYCVNVASMLFSAGIAMRAAMKIAALKEVVMNNNVQGSADALNLNMEDIFYNPNILVDKYNEITSSCPGLSVYPDLENSYFQFTQKSIYDKLDATLGPYTLFGDARLENQLGVDIPGADTWPEIEPSKPISELRPPETNYSDPETDYPDECPTGDTEDPYSDDYVEECDPDDESYIGEDMSWPELGVSYPGAERYPESNLPEDWPENVEGPMKRSLQFMLESDPDFKQDMEALHDELLLEFSNTVIAPLEEANEGAQDLENYCNPILVMHWMILAKFARYFTEYDIQVRYGKWNFYADMIGTFTIANKIDHLTVVLELAQIGDVVLAEMPEWANAHNQFIQLEQRACDDSRAIRGWLLKFIQEAEAVAAQEGLYFNYQADQGHTYPDAVGSLERLDMEDVMNEVGR